METFQRSDSVWINYPNSITTKRAALVVEDDGGPNVKVSWHAKLPDRGRPNRRNAHYVGPEHVQSIPRERLTPRTVA
jgi:hypothetical protein